MLARELKRLGTQSAIYGLGGIVSLLIAIFLLPIYTVYLGPVGFGKIETIVAPTAVCVIVLRLGITSAFYRFYFDSEDEARRTLVVRTSFWFTMGTATLGLALGWIFADQISYVLTSLLFITCWMSLALGALAPWLVDLLAPDGHFSRSAEAVPVLCFATAAYSGYSVLAIGIGRMRQTQLNWVVSGAAALVNIALNILLIPPYGMMGAAVAALVAYLTLFVGMWLRSRHVYPVHYQWRRIITLAGVAVGLTAIAWALHSLPAAIALTLVYPLVLLPLGFYLPAELTRRRRLAPG